MGPPAQSHENQVSPISAQAPGEATPRTPASPRLIDLIDVPLLQSMMEDFYALTHIPMSLIDLSGQMVVGAGWQDACIRFHRVNPETCAHCVESDTVLTADIPPGEARLYRCKNGMWDAATPVMVGDEHVGNVFTGQFFFDDESVDLGFFKEQAHRYGFEEEAYLKAIEAMPRLSRQNVETGLRFLTKLSTMISHLAISNAERERAKDQLQDALADEQHSASLLGALAKVNEILLSAITVDDVTARLVGEASQSAGADKSLVIEVDGSEYVVRHVRNVPDELMGRAEDASFFPGFALAVRTRRPVLIGDTFTDPRTNKDFVVPYDLHAFQLLPLIVDDVVTHVVAFAYDEPRVYNEADEEAAERMAAAMSAALSKAQLLEAEREASRLNEALMAIDRSIHSILTTSEMLDRVVIEAADALGCESSAMDIRENDAWVVRHVYQFPADSVGRSFTDAEVPFAAMSARERGPIVIDDAFADPRVDPGVQRAYNVRSVMVTPIIVQDEVLGVLFFNYHTNRHTFTQAEVTFARRLSASLSLALANARLYEKEQRIANTLQEMLVVIPARVPGISFSRAYESATLEIGSVGGDFVDIFEVDGSVVGIAVGDVSGKGIDAAVITSFVRNTLRVHAADGLPPSEVCSKTSHVLQRFTPSDIFVTAFFGLLDSATGVLRYVNAGHPAALLFGDGEHMEELDPSTTVLGAFDDLACVERQAVLGLGQRLMLYTDGITEARSPQGAFLGLEGLQAVVRRHAAEPMPSLAQVILEDVKEFSSHELRDDIAILVLERAEAVQA